MSDKKIFNILHVISRLPVGGAENMLLKEVRGYSKDIFRAGICCIQDGGKIADELLGLGYKVTILHKMKGHGFDPGAVTALYRLIKKENIHIIRTHQYHANLYGRISGILAGVPVIISTVHNLYEFPSQPKMHRRFFNYFLSFFTDALVAVSNAVASDIIKFDWVNPAKVKVIYNGIMLETFSNNISKEEARGILALPSDLLIIGTVGNLTAQKGHRFLIEAASGIKDTCVAIAGEGPIKDELMDFARQLKVNCIFLGTIEPQKIPVFLRSLDIFCFPSLWEGFGVALLEAMASGLPIVASDILPHREVVVDDAILVSPGNSSSLSDALKMLIKDPSLRAELGKKAIEKAGIFSIENTVKAYEDLFEQLLRQKNLS
jgi:glycosyltransferase involved in cell wall biosynthesis